MTDLMHIYTRLIDAYGPRDWWPADTPFEVAVGAILTQNTNWKNVERAIANLQREQALTAHALHTLERDTLERLIRPSGFFRQKSERLQLLAAHLLEKHDGNLEQLLAQPLSVARSELLGLKGIGPETADSILLYAGNLPSFVIDAYTRRLLTRLGRCSGRERYDQLRSLFMQTLPAEVALYNEYHALIVEHCKRYCRTQPICDLCPLVDICAHARALEPL